MSALRILYVEDNALDGDLARQQLAREAPDVRLDIAATLAEARVRLAAGATYDAVLTDVNLPDGSGLELVTELRQRSTQAAVMVVTGVDAGDTAVAALKAGADTFIVKRVDYLHRLLPAIRAAVARFRSEGVRRSRRLRVMYAATDGDDADLVQQHLAAFAPHFQLDAVAGAAGLLARLPAAAGTPCPCDVVLLDSARAGTEVLEILKAVYDERRLDVPLVLATSQDDGEAAAQVLRLGAAHCLVKRRGYQHQLPAILEAAADRAELERERTALRDSEAFSRAILDSVTQQIAILDRDGRVVGVNSAWRRFALENGGGPAAAEPLGVDYLAACEAATGADRESAQAVAEAIRAVLAGAQRSYSLEYACHSPAVKRWFQMTIAPLAGARGGAVVVHENLTDIKQTARALQKELERSRLLFEQSSDGIVVFDEELRVVEANPHFAASLGYTMAELLRLHLWDIESQWTKGQLTAAFADAGRPAETMETRHRRKDGTEIEVEISGSAAQFDGRILRFNIVRDITARKAVERRNRQLASLVRHAQEFIAIATLGGRVEYINDFGRQLVGIAADERPTSREIAGILHTSEHDRLTREIMPALNAAGHWSGELALRRSSDGVAVPTLTEGFRIDDVDGRPLNFALVSRDITDLKAADAALRRLNRIHLTLSHTNQAIVRASTEAELLERICAIATESGGFAVAWVGLLDDTGRLRAVAVAGDRRAYVEGLTLTADERLAEGRGPAGSALRSGRHVVCNDFAADEITRPWWDRARQFGIASSAAFPLIEAGRAIGLLSVYSTVRGHFGEPEISLLDDIAADISFGLESLHRAIALDRSIEQLRDIEAAVRVGAFRLILPQWLLWWSEGTPAVLGLPDATRADRATFEAAVGPEVALILCAALDEAVQNGDPIDLDLPLRGRSAEAQWVRLFGVPKRRKDGTTEVSCTLQDISERKRLESEVAAAADAERRRLAFELHDNLGQMLVGTSLMLSSVAREARKTDSALLPRVEQTAKTLNEALRVCRAIAHGAEPVVEGGLSVALRELAARTTATGVDCVAVTSDAANALVTGPRALELYRITQEAVTNALKHAQCRRVDIDVTLRGPVLELVIRDDGRGLGSSGPVPSEGIGLRTMRYRAARAGGVLEVRSKPGSGTTVRVRVPLLPANERRASRVKR